MTLEKKAREQYLKVLEQREEILKAFIAKYNLQPDEVEHIYQVDNNTGETHTWLRKKVVFKPKSMKYKERLFWDKYPDLLIDDEHSIHNDLIGKVRAFVKDYFRQSELIDNPIMDISIPGSKLKAWHYISLNKLKLFQSMPERFEIHKEVFYGMDVYTVKNKLNNLEQMFILTHHFNTDQEEEHNEST